MKNNKYINLFLGTALFLLLSITNVFAYELTWPDSPAGTSIQDGANITTLVKYIYEWGISIGVLCAFIALIIAGVKYMTSTGNTSKITEAKQDIKDAFIGLALLLSSWLILNTINPALTDLKIPTIEGNKDPFKNSFKPQELPKGKCVKVIFWDNTNFKGNEKTIEEKDFKEKPALFKVKTWVPGVGGKLIEVATDINPRSFIAYRELAKNGDQKLIDDKLCENYQQQNAKYCENGFIRDDTCTVELYAPSPFWDILNSDCGDKLLSMNGSCKDVTKMLANPTEDLECYKIMQADESY